MTPSTLLALFFVLLVLMTGALIALLVLRHQQEKQHQGDLERYSAIIDVEAAAKRLNDKLRARKEEGSKQLREQRQQITQLQSDYKHKRGLYENLVAVVSALEEDLEFVDLGLYKPHFDYSDSEQYKAAIKESNERQRESVRKKDACKCDAEWTVEGSRVKGKQMTDRQVKLMLRAFNGECDSAIGKVNWNNVQKMEERIGKAFAALNKLGEPNHVYLTHDYMALKLAELWLTFENKRKIQEEKEEQRQIKEQMREEARVQREIEAAQKAAEKEEAVSEKALQQAREEVSRATEEEKEALNRKIQEMEALLEEAHAKRERAVARAQLTKSGHVYVISNIGSFGQDIYKIGMTRRLEPLDRVKELGDASVPFAFDIHAMIYSDNAPELESTLHREFDAHRVNLVNFRKEFFRVPLDQIEERVRTQGLTIEFTKLAEAEEYRESLSKRDHEQLLQEQKKALSAQIPQAI